MDYFSTFTGISGFEKGIEDSGAGFNCVGCSEIDKYAAAISKYHYPNHKNYGDITTIAIPELPDFNLLVGGFPCQSFSIAGRRQGFEDTRGTLFFDVARILKGKRPEWILLENVKNILSHDDYATIFRIYEILTELGYTVGWQVVNSCQFGVPQSRERIFIVGHLREAGGRAGEVLPFRESKKKDNSKSVQQPNHCISGTLNNKNNSGELSVDKGTVLVKGSLEERDISTAIDANYHKGMDNHGQRTMIKSGTWRTHKDGRGFREVESGLAPTLPARAREDGSGQPVVVISDSGKGRKKEVREKTFPPLRANNGGGYNDYISGERIRRLTPKECERLQGFPDDWTKFGIMDGKKVEISDTQRYKSLGNAVTVNVIEAIIRNINKVITTK